MARLALVTLALVALAAAASASAIPWFHEGTARTKLIVTYNIIPDVFKKTNFVTMPRNVDAAMKAGFTFQETRSSDNTDVYCRKQDYRVCVLFGQRGYLAGLRVAVAKSELEQSKAPNVDVASIPEWEETVAGRTPVYALTIFFSPKEELLAGGRHFTSDDLTAPNGLYFLQTSANGTETGRLHVSNEHSGAVTAGFTEQACFFGMGKHYFQELRKDGSCDAHRPYFLLYGPKTQELIGFGISMFGKTTVAEQPWFEHPPAVVTKMIAPNSPKCLVDYANTFGMFTLHVYFVADPFFTSC